MTFISLTLASRLSFFAESARVPSPLEPVRKTLDTTWRKRQRRRVSNARLGRAVGTTASTTSLTGCPGRRGAAPGENGRCRPWSDNPKFSQSNSPAAGGHRTSHWDGARPAWAALMALLLPGVDAAREREVSGRSAAMRRRRRRTPIHDLPDLNRIRAQGLLHSMSTAMGHLYAVSPETENKLMVCLPRRALRSRVMLKPESFKAGRLKNAAISGRLCDGAFKYCVFPSGDMRAAQVSVGLDPALAGAAVQP